MRFWRFALIILSTIFYVKIYAQHIATFQSLKPSIQNEVFQFPDSTHTFQRIISVDDKIDNGIMPSNFDFTGYVPIQQSSTNGYLGINSEYYLQGGMTIMNVQFDAIQKRWNYSSPQLVDFINSVEGTRSNCSGAVTPWNTLITCEETSSSENNTLGYKKYGWCIEVEPETRSVKSFGTNNGDKLWKAGLGNHENAVIHKNKRTLYTGLDQYEGVLYKFVSDNPSDLSSGKLYALKMTDYYSGYWKRIPNNTIQECNNSYNYAISNACKTFNGIEDVEIDKNGKVYFAVKSIGTIYRFTDIDPLNQTDSSIVDFDVFVGNQTSIYGQYLSSYNIRGIETEWGYGNDNLAFDNEDNLWVLNDGSNNAIWVVGPYHNNDDIQQHQVRIFGYAPAGAEPTGISFTPDNSFIFMSFQHPYSSNLAQIYDADSSLQRFNKDIAIVIARRENLGKSFPAFAFTSFEAIAKDNKIELNFKTKNNATILKYNIQRLNTANAWENIFSLNSDNTSNNYTFFDINATQGLIYYRVEAIDNNGNTYYSNVNLVRFNPQIFVRPNPFNTELKVLIHETNNVQSIALLDVHQKTIYKFSNISNSNMEFTFDTKHLQSGLYSIVVYNTLNEIIYVSRVSKLNE